MLLKAVTFFALFAGIHTLWTEVITKKCYEEQLNAMTSRRHCFFSPNWGTYWTDAQKWCRDRQSHLAVISNPKIQGYVEKFVTLAGLSHYVWTGAMLRMCVKGDWIWNDGTYYREKQLIISESSSDDDFRTAVALTVNKGLPQLISHNPSDLLAYICHYPSYSKRCTTSKNSYHYKDRCYVLHNEAERHSWYDARTSCMFDDGDLASFDGHFALIDLTWLKSIGANQSVWIGLRNSQWMWHSEDGITEVKYAQFSPDSSRSSNKRCLVLDYKNPWQWTGYYCAAREPHFICHTAVDDDITTKEHHFERGYYYIDGPYPDFPPMSAGCIIACLLALVMFWLFMEITFNRDDIWSSIRVFLINIFSKSIYICRRIMKPKGTYSAKGNPVMTETYPTTGETHAKTFIL